MSMSMTFSPPPAVLWCAAGDILSQTEGTFQQNRSLAREKYPIHMPQGNYFPLYGIKACPVPASRAV
jgi:hypothetical protein